MNRRIFLTFAAGTALLARLYWKRSGTAVAKGIDIDAILHDSNAPGAGHPDGDVIVATFSDYGCPFCKAAALDKLVADDGGVRIVHKDWPILSEASLYGAPLALTAKYRGQYDTVHRALMALPGARSPQERMLTAVRGSGVDVVSLQDDLRDYAGDINALLVRNPAQERALGLEEPPTYPIERLLYNTLDYDGFHRAVSEARRQAAPEGSS